VQGALGGLMFWWLGLPAPIVWGVVMAVLAILPMFGAALVWVPAAGFLAIEGDLDKALLLTAWGTLVVGLIDNLLYPVLVKGRLRMHTVPVFISVLGGLFAFGATGVVLGPLILAVAIALLEIWRRRMADGDIESAVNHAPADRDAAASSGRRRPAAKSTA
jgi:predicted PurR-regulated permease PerM